MVTKYNEIAVRKHRLYQGKVATTLKVPIKSIEDFAVWYTPGVAAPCRKIVEVPSKVYDYTNRANFVAIISDGSRVLGLGNIGPHAALPVMEGKALLFKYLGDVDTVPLCLATQEPEEIIAVVKQISPTFGGINLEDIASPKCFYIYERLFNELEIPVFHDDQQGSAVVALAGLINAMKVVGKKIKQADIALIGAGAAGLSVAQLLIAFGVNAKKLIIADSKGILHSHRRDLNPWKSKLARITNPSNRIGGIKEAMKDADAVIAFSKPGPGVITKEMIRVMAERPIVFALANPIPEIMPSQALKAGTEVVATGRSDFPNQINNCIGFPAIFRGMLDVRAKKINTTILLAVAQEIALYAEEKGLSRGYIIPTIDELDVFPRAAVSVAKAAIESGVAQLKIDLDQLFDKTKRRILKIQTFSKTKEIFK